MYSWYACSYSPAWSVSMAFLTASMARPMKSELLISYDSIVSPYTYSMRRVLPSGACRVVNSGEAAVTNAGQVEADVDIERFVVYRAALEKII